MQSETVIIMIVGLLAIGLIRLVIAMVGREFAADHPHVKSKSDAEPSGSSTEDSGLTPEVAVPSQRPVRGTGKNSHLYQFPSAEETTSADSETTEAEPAAS